MSPLRTLTLNIEKARAQHRIQRADLFPAIGATGSQTAQRLPGALTSSGEAEINRQYNAMIGFSAYELDFFGRIRSLNAAALEQYLGTEEARRSAQISLVAEVAGTCLTLAFDNERLALARSTYETRQKSHDLIRRSFEAGAVSALDLNQSQQLLQSARADVAISTSTAAGTASSTLDGLFSGGSGAWSFIPLIRIPVFEAGRLQASLDVAEVQRDINVAQYEKAIQSAFREVADALADRASLAERLDARYQQVEATQAAFRLSDARYKGGADSFLGLLDAQRSLYLAEQELIIVRLADAANRVTLYKVLGGGWR